MSTSHTTLRLAIAMACAYSVTANAALVEKREKSPRTSAMNIISLAQHIQERPFGPIIITPKHEAELKRIAIKHSPKFKQEAWLFGFLKSFGAGQGNPTCLAGITTNIIEFVGVPLLNYTKCPRNHDKDSDWTIGESVLVVTEPVRVGLGAFSIYNRATGGLLCREKGARFAYHSGFGPRVEITEKESPLSTPKNPLWNTTVGVEDLDMHNNTCEFENLKTGAFSPLLLRNQFVLHNEAQQKNDVERMDLPQAIALNTIKSLATKGAIFRENELLLCSLTPPQRAGITKVSEAPIVVEKSRKRK